jgi:hypothetical protein
VKPGVAAIPGLISVLDNKERSQCYDSCSQQYQTYGQLAFLIIDHIEPIPYALVTNRQWCIVSQCGYYPDGFLDFVDEQGKEFKRLYSEYFVSAERKQVLQH